LHRTSPRGAAAVRLRKDAQAGRFGSSLGDNAVDIYRHRRGTAP
jgi:hypothetical protein